RGTYPVWTYCARLRTGYRVCPRRSNALPAGSLPLNPAVELNDTHRPCPVDLAERRSVEPRRRAAQVDVVQRVEHIRADLQLHPFGQPEVPAEVQVRRPTAGASDRAIPQIARPD